jgi:hypothetical protein
LMGGWRCPLSHLSIIAGLLMFMGLANGEARPARCQL